jgi:sugar O-acyltransferase (sialic acid O-acetyltransferase NeuD family)
MDFYIIGSGGFAKEVYFLYSEMENDDFSFKGFIDFQPISHFLQIGGEEYDILDEDSFLGNYPTESRSEIALALGLGNASKLKEVISKFSGFTFPNFIHPNVIWDKKSFRLGEGNILTAGCVITVDIEIGDFNILNLNTTIGHDTKIGSYNVFNPGCNISGGVSIGDSNLFGTNSTILQNLKVGSKSILGAGAVLTKSLESSKLAVGVPANAVKNI